MNPAFREIVDSLHPKFELLRSAPACVPGAQLPKKGVYLFTENGAQLYVGRSNRIPQRLRQHVGHSSQPHQAAFATLIAREETKRAVDYRQGARERRISDDEFMESFRRAKDRVRAMEFRAVEECDQTRQALLEVYCAIALETKYNDFGTH